MRKHTQLTQVLALKEQYLLTILTYWMVIQGNQVLCDKHNLPGQRKMLKQSMLR